MKTVFFDVDTQIDFLYPAGALYVPGSEALVPLIAELNRKAPTVISTMDAHAEDEAEFQLYPSHCVKGCLGQRKPAATLLGDPKQIFLEKQSVNCFSVATLADLLGELAADRYVVYGVVTEICVKNAAMGLLKTGKRVEIVTDVVKHIGQTNAEQFFADFQSAGGVLVTSAEVLA
jgi:nicotinamidase/pyrazinamidase